MKKFLVILAVTLFVAAACVPNISDLNLSGCMKECNATAKSCLDAADAKLTKCMGEDICQKLALDDSKRCLTEGMDCIAVCVEIAEQKLKE